MATSRSPDDEADWTAGAELFSGRRDPTWAVSPATARRLVARWESLPESRRAAPDAPPLGYRGCFLRDPRGREWRAYGGAVEHRSEGRVERRRDDGRAFEREVLASAPPDRLPGDLVQP